MKALFNRLFGGFGVSWWVKFGCSIVIFFFCVAFTLPTFLGDRSNWPRTNEEGKEVGTPVSFMHRIAERFLPDARVALGLDLRGGLHLVLEVDVDASAKENISRALSRVVNRAADQKIVLSSAKVGDDFVARIISEDASKLEDVKKIVSEETPLLLFDAVDGTTIVFKPAAARLEERKAQILQQAINTIRNRIDQFGVAEPSIFAQGDRRIVVQMPGLTDTDRARELIGNTARLDFRLVNGTFDQTKLNTLLSEARTALQIQADDYAVPSIEKLSEWLRENQKIPAENTVLLGREFKNEAGVTKIIGTTPYLVELNPKLTGDFIDTADAGQSTGSLLPTYVVNMSFSPQGAKLFGELTTEAYKPENSPNQIAIVLDGNVNSAPSVNNGPILTGRAEITMGNPGFDMNAVQKEAQDLALVLRAGALPAKVNIVEDRQVGPSEGAANIRAGVVSSAVSGLIVIIFMLAVYGLSGLIANIAMIFNGLLILAILAAFGATLTLPGIAGIVLTMAIAVDTNVIINERIREELRNGVAPRIAFYRGYTQSSSALLDSYVTSIIAALVLLIYGNPAIKGFSVSFLTGTLTTIFTSYYVTEVIGTWLMEKTKIRSFS